MKASAAPEMILDSEYGTKPKAPASSVLHLRWSRLHKTVPLVGLDGAGLLRGSIATPTKRSDTLPPTTKTIISKVSGSAAPGKILALMGPSGSGKTTLLNCLSGRTQYDSGDITVNGVPLTSQMKKRLMTKIAYVKQADIFFTDLSVRDQLTYTAFLRLPQSFSKKEKLQEVDKILQLLRLEKVADSKIFLLSGGEKKRVNIGTELLTDPSCLLLDEPTSGLDSTSAVSLMQLLHDLARSQHKTVITSIHQPSSRVFFSFDQVMLLAEGHAVYFGTPENSLDYLNDHNMACPNGYNAADHWMDMLVISNHTASPNSTLRDDPDSIEEDIKRSNQLLIEAWDNDALAKQMDQESEEQKDQDDGTVNYDDNKKISKYNTTWAMQYRVLVHRALKNSRSAILHQSIW